MQEYRASISTGVKHVSVSEVTTCLTNISCESHLRKTFLLISYSPLCGMLEQVSEQHDFDRKGINIAVKGTTELTF